MRAALVCQPLDSVFPPIQTSLGIWTNDVARDLAEHCEVVLYTRRSGTPQEDLMHGSVTYRLIRSFHYRLWRVVLRPLDWFRRDPSFSSILFCLDYAVQVAIDVRNRKCDVVHIHNFSQLVPVMRLFNPHVFIVLHMNCEWLSQLDEDVIGERLGGVDLILGCSDFITDRIKARFPSISSRCKTLYNGVSTEVFSFTDSVRRGVPHDPVILFVGRCSPEKGLHVLFDAFHEILERFPSAKLVIAGLLKAAPWDFIVVGAPDEKVAAIAHHYHGDYLRRQLKRLPDTVVARIEILGHVPHRELAVHFESADVFVFPSVWNEPSGIPQIEAMATGVPVVATRVGGIPEYVLDSQTGLLVEPGDAKALAAAVLNLIEHENLRREIVARAHRRVRKMFTIKHLAREVFSRYEALQRPAGARASGRAAGPG